MLKKITGFILGLFGLIVFFTIVYFSVIVVKDMIAPAMSFRNFAVYVYGRFIILLTKSIVFWSGGIILVSRFIERLLRKSKR